MNEDFTEEEFDDDLPEGIEFAEPATPIPKAPAVPQRPAQRPAQRPVQRPQQRPVSESQKRRPAVDEATVERFTPFMMPKRIGVLDNETQQPLMEDQDTNTLLLGLVTKLLNDVDDIKKNL